ncbi:chemotaxis response regulator protein-glutamate methylesterase [Pseudochryseolinea flava]|uniref:Protein-glutamate methylesterase/protein-glutamine glutaminase n=2 Tax=Pseudochryseolinea flava TaxID=2059302 RepID=A0A364Y1Q5_9BACT|nr:chemotaxis response regulator protein-glutamate methylesterase [Pseudochryseolinea flava]
MSNAKIKVLVIDDAALVRKTLREWINAQEDMEVIGVAADPYIAVDKMRVQKPDVITLDIEMPRMDGLTFLRKLMEQHPIPVIIVSSLTSAAVAVKAMEYGAVDVFLKDNIRVVSNDHSGYDSLVSRIRVAHQARIKRLKPSAIQINPVHELNKIGTSDKIIVLGASTGGTTAIHNILSALPIDTPGMVIVQHMPREFTKHFAARLNELSVLTVKEAEDGERVLPGKVLICPGGIHVKVLRHGATTVVKLWDGEPVNLHKPSVDVLFDSAADQLGKNCIGVLLTGMGKDGAQGLLAMKKKGAFTIAQDEATSVVYGMPKEAAKLNAVDKILPLENIPNELVTLD